MSMLDTIGGLGGGLGGSGGVGGSIPSNSSAANSAATATIQPTTTLGTVGGGYNAYGPFSVNFPGVNTGSGSDINSPPFTQRVLPSSTLMIGIVLAIVAVMFFVLRKG